MKDGDCKLQLTQAAWENASAGQKANESRSVNMTSGDHQAGSPLQARVVPWMMGHGSLKAWSSCSEKLICLEQRAEILIPALN